MTGAFGYTVAIVVAALALRRLPVEVARWRVRRRSRLLTERSAGVESPGTPAAPSEGGMPWTRATPGMEGSPGTPATPSEGGMPWTRATPGVAGSPGTPAAPPEGGPLGTPREPRAGRAGRAGRSVGGLRRRLRRAMDDAAVASGESQAFAVWGAAVGVGALGGLLLAGMPGAAAGAAAGLLGPPAALWASRHRRARLVVEELPDFLERAARSLRAGVSTGTALEEALPASGPLAAELRRVLEDVRAGSPLPVALDRWRSRCRLPEVNLAAAALSIGASTGGRRAPAVDGVAATLRGVRATQREVASLAQQGRLSGLLIALLPLCFVGMSAMVDSGSVLALYGTPLGLVGLVAGGVLNLVAFVWMHRITRLP